MELLKCFSFTFLLICIINTSIGDSSEQLDSLSSSIRISNQTEDEDKPKEIKENRKAFDKIIEEHFNTYEQKIRPYKRLENQWSVEDLESSHDYFKQFVILRFQANIRNIASENKTFLSAKLEEKIEEFHRKDFENILRSENVRALITKDDVAPVKKLPAECIADKFLPPTCKLFRIALVADLDEKSKKKNTDDVYSSFLKTGFLAIQASEDKVELSWDDELIEIKSGFSFQGRGMELSELIVSNDELLAFDDKTGIVFKIISGKVFPWVILTDGNKGFKSEWATEKDGFLYIGSIGLEKRNKNDGSAKYNLMNVHKVFKNGLIETLKWAKNYEALRNVTGFQSPGYIIHEAVVWSEIHKRWFFLPRFCSKEIYDPKISHGCNLLMIADEKFEDIKVVDIPLRGEYRKIQGFSSLKFLPGTNDTIIAALKTTETDEITNTFVAVFDIFGCKIFGKIDVFLDKYEGIEFVEEI